MSCLRQQLNGRIVTEWYNKHITDCSMKTITVFINTYKKRLSSLSLYFRTVVSVSNKMPSHS